MGKSLLASSKAAGRCNESLKDSTWDLCGISNLKEPVVLTEEAVWSKVGTRFGMSGCKMKIRKFLVFRISNGSY